MNVSREFKVGITIVVALAIVVGFFTWSGYLRMNTRSLVVVFDDVNGLKNGDPVTFRGMNVGKVNSLTILNEGVKVEFSIDKSLTLYNDAVAEITMVSLMSGKKINLFPGTSTSGILSSNVTLKGQRVKDVPDLIASTDKMMDTLEALSHILFASLSRVNAIMNDENLTLDFKTTLRNMAVVSEDVKQVTQVLRKTDLNRLISGISNTSESIDKLSKKYDPIVDTTFKDVSKALRQMSELFAIITPVVYRVSVDDKTLVGKVLNDPDFMQRLDSTLRHFNYLLEEAKKSGGIPVKFKLF